MTDNMNGVDAGRRQVKGDKDLPRDGTLNSCLLFEPPVKAGNISLSGLHFIANHKYRPCEYTHLDNILNPVWAYLTELLPLWLAPNMVTTIGGLHCGVAYALLWWYSPDFDESTPDWVVLLAGWCTIAYFTLDCMDGKQARRTGSSSPLGQLFDHGFDCICALFFMATIGSYLMIGGTYWYILLQTTLQFAFFMAQWEEYHTHVLPHCAGKWFGVTETNYSLGMIAIVNSFLDREAFYHRPMELVLAPLGDSMLDQLPTALRELELRHFLMAGWGVTSVILMALSLKRVLSHPRVSSTKLRLHALSKLATPFALCLAAFLVPPNAVRTRYLSVTLGLAFSLITKKMIVFSMAKMTFAIVQWDAMPFLLLALWIKFDERLTKMGADFVLGTASLW
eukprot:CAMPEP_0172553374 /NCGR_PEP_ID=MMETSP1067-20121228/50440_1 /TAXON_ID=265564 ORGANISM="Thalassiosira punctigera, Strain Tpunct2005C2" /NCGR_SAMPLE_ID=MMETSP1067 /ASSEMBLY_ACC=CAM_ASM_000444 /LENGTH=393 /DNA_ID=CAMNT_0013341549 /DNA_START=45 /DNA_END=1223 /DNA_ORIENTATION=+